MIKTSWVSFFLALVAISAQTRREVSAESRVTDGVERIEKELIGTLRALIERRHKTLNVAKREWAETPGCDSCNDDTRDLCCKGGGYPGMSCTAESPCCLRFRYFGDTFGYKQCNKKALVELEEQDMYSNQGRRSFDKKDNDKKEIEKDLLQLLIRKVLEQ